MYVDSLFAQKNFHVFYHNTCFQIIGVRENPETMEKKIFSCFMVLDTFIIKYGRKSVF